MAAAKRLPWSNRVSTASVDDFVAGPVLLSAAIAENPEDVPDQGHEGEHRRDRATRDEPFSGTFRCNRSPERPGGLLRLDGAPSEVPRQEAWQEPVTAARRRRTPLKYAALSKQDEIDAADAQRRGDHAGDPRPEPTLSNTEKRALLAERLVPRLTLTTIKRNRDGLNRIFKAAAALGCRTVPIALPYREIERHIAAQAPDDPLYVRVTQPKLRMPWTEERLARFLTCPLFTGCFSEHRRGRPGTVIIRDFLYWVPLIVLTIGSRIEEILLLKRRNLVYRNQTYCLAIGLDCDQHGKTPDAERVVPIPQLLLDLGFVDWITSLPDDHGPLLFPDAAARTEIDDLTGPSARR